MKREHHRLFPPTNVPTTLSRRWSEVKVIQACPTLCDPMDYTVHEILQSRILEWIAFLFSRGSSQPRDQTQVSCIAGGFFTSWVTRKTQYRSGQPIPSPGDLPNSEIELQSPALQADSLPAELSGKPFKKIVKSLYSNGSKRAWSVHGYFWFVCGEVSGS